MAIGIIAILAALLLPALSRAKLQSLKASCVSQLRQQGIAWRLYLDDNGGRFPDRRDLKKSLPGGYRPWDSWPASDPRAGWAALVLRQPLPNDEVWSCPALRDSFVEAAQVVQLTGTNATSPAVRYWMWRFDRFEDPVPSDNFWGRTEAGCVAALREAASPFIGIPTGPSDVELAVDVYFPDSIRSISGELSGRTPHAGGRNRLMLDGHVQFWRDKRTPRH